MFLRILNLNLKTSVRKSTIVNKREILSLEYVQHLRSRFEGILEDRRIGDRRHSLVPCIQPRLLTDIPSGRPWR